LIFRNIACGTGLVAMACAQALLAEKNAGTNVGWQPVEPSASRDRDD
jgi:hypothetical protein